MDYGSIARATAQDLVEKVRGLIELDWREMDFIDLGSVNQSGSLLSSGYAWAFEV